MRELRRAIARRKMIEEGCKHLNRRRYDLFGNRTESFFAENWKKYYAKATREAGAK